MATRKKPQRPARALHKERFPGESARYRTARNRLLKAEMDLRRRLEAVAALRRKLPSGGTVLQDYGRHVDLIWPLWNLFDFTPDGRGIDWHPKLHYGA